MTSVCTERLFLSYLIRKLDRARPQIIVIDKYFSPTACREGDLGTQQLTYSLAHVSATTPIVIGTTDQLIDPRDESSHPRYIPSVQLAFSGGSNQNIRVGNIRLAPDGRTIPLLWHLFRGESDKTGYYVNSLALEVALIRTPNLLTTHPALGRLTAGRRFPFTSFITTVPIDVIPAGNFVFGSAPIGPEETWPSAISLAPSADFINRLRGRIVFIGENQPYIDQWQTEFGTVPGVVLQANYVESLLDGRYFEPVPWYWNFAVGFLIFVVFHLVLIWVERFVPDNKSGPLVHLVLAAAAAVAVILFSFYALAAIAVFFGRYIDPLNLSLTAIWVSVLHVLFHRMEHKGGSPAASLSTGGTPDVSHVF